MTAQGDDAEPAPDHGGAGDGDSLLQKVEDVAELTRKANESSAQLWARVAELEDTTAEVIERITDTPAGGPWAWRYLDPYETVALFHEVRDWVDWMVVRYQVGSVVLPCWYQHGAAVEELTALYVSWRATYQAKPTSYSDDLTAFHDRWFWSCMQRLEYQGVFKGCTRLRHAEDEDRTRITDPAQFHAHMDALMDGAQPGRDAEQIHAAIDAGSAIALRPKDPTSPVKCGDTWWAILANSPDGAWVPRPERVGSDLDKLLEKTQGTPKKQPSTKQDN